MINLKDLKSIFEDRAFQDGGSPLAPRPPATTRLDGKDRLEGCIPSSTNPPRLSTPPDLSMGGDNLQVSFGLSTAPRVFTKLLKPVVGFLRQNGCRLIIYLDDLLMMHQDRAQLEQITHVTCQLFESLGLMVNLKKSILTPTQELEFLTFQVDSIRMKLLLPPERLQQDARKMMHQASVSVREVELFVGKTTTTLRAIPLAPLHYRALQANEFHPFSELQSGGNCKQV